MMNEYYIVGTIEISKTKFIQILESTFEKGTTEVKTINGDLVILFEASDFELDSTFLDSNNEYKITDYIFHARFYNSEEKLNKILNKLTTNLKKEKIKYRIDYQLEDKDGNPLNDEITLYND